MRVERFHDPQKFQYRVLPALSRQEAENHLVLGILTDLLGGRPRLADSEPVLCAVEDDSGKLEAAGVWAGPALIVTQGRPDAMEALAEFMVSHDLRPPGVSGPADAATAFAIAWTQAADEPHTPGRKLKIMELRSIAAAPRRIGGSLRPAEADDLPLLSSWTQAFESELRLRPGERARDLPWRIEQNRLFVWCDPTPVSMAAAAGPTPGGVRVNLVYTPPEHRGRGYAPACVAALSQRLLDSGRRSVFLFVDADNRITTQMYRSIGFQTACDWLEYDFISSSLEV